MRRASLLLAILCVVVLSAFTFAEKEQPGVAWTENIPEAVAEAERTGKPVLVNIWAAWCPPCKTMDETTYRDPDVCQAIENFVPLKVNADLHQLFIMKYRIDGYPTVLVLDGDGQEITRLIGLVDAPVMLDSLEKIHAEYEDYLEAKESK